MTTIIDTKNMFDRCAPTADVVIAAVRRAEDEEKLYTVRADGSGWKVTRNGEKSRAYIQTKNPFAPDAAFPLTCTCPAHERNGYCKHVAIVENYEAIEAAASDYHHRHEAEYAGRY